MNSSREKSRQILGMISPTHAQRLLLDWVNTDPFSRDRNAPRRLVLRYPEVFGVNPAIYDESFPTPDKNTPEYKQWQRFRGQVWTLISSVSLLLREAWDAADPRKREWLFIKSRLSYHVNVERLENMGRDIVQGPEEVSEIRDGVEQPKAPIRSLQVNTRDDLDFAFHMKLLLLPEVPLTPFEAAMFYLQTHLADKIRRCPNATCPAPYFFAAKRAQKFCSTKCAEPAQRESKRRWWNENRGVSGVTKRKS